MRAGSDDTEGSLSPQILLARRLGPILDATEEKWSRAVTFCEVQESLAACGIAIRPTH